VVLVIESLALLVSGKQSALATEIEQCRSPDADCSASRKLCNYKKIADVNDIRIDDKTIIYRYLPRALSS